MEKFSKLKKIMVRRTPKKRKQKFKYVTINFIVTYLNISLGFSCGSDGKESICNVGDLGSIPGLGRSPGEGNNYPPVFLPREFHGRRSLAGYSPWGRKKLDMTE